MKTKIFNIPVLFSILSLIAGAAVTALPVQPVYATPIYLPQTREYNDFGPPALSISTSSLPNGETGVAYSAPLAVTNGVPPYTWSITAGALPIGLPDPPVSDIIAGTPSAAGTFNFTLHCVDANSASASKDLSITIYPGLAITTAALLPPGQSNMTYNQTLDKSGGHGAVTWTKTAGTLPGTVTLDPATGVLSGTPSTAGTFNFTVKALDAITYVTKDMSITINGPVISTASLPDGEAGLAYSGATLAATGGIGTYTWSVDPGSPNSLPSALALDSTTGNISGIPDASTGGAISITFKAIDSVGATATKSLSLNIREDVSIITVYLPDGEVGIPYAGATLEATDGAGPYIWSTSAGSLPAGLHIDANSGNISGTPTTAGGPASITFMVTDNLTANSTKSLPITIYSALALTTVALPEGDTGVAYGQTLGAAGGTGNYTWTITAGSLPSGLTLSGDNISGTPTTNSTSNFTTQVNDGIATATRGLSITINPALVVTTTSMPNGNVGTSYSQALTAAGGTGNYTWTISAGSLPSGLTLSGDNISGTPTTAATSNFTVQANDGITTATRVLSITINPALVVTTTSMPNGNVGTSYSQALAASGGTGNYTWTISVGSLPAGLTLSGNTISGLPTTNATSNFTAQANDGIATATKALSITINPAVITTGGGGGSVPGYTYVPTNTQGVFTQTVDARSNDGKIDVTIDQGTIGKTRDGNNITQMSVLRIATPPAPPANSNVIGLTYNFSPEGATFSPPITVTFNYGSSLPAGVNEKDLVIAFYDATSGIWVALDGITIDPVAQTISGKVSHFTAFAVLTNMTPSLTPILTPTMTPAPVTVTATVSTTISVPGQTTPVPAPVTTPVIVPATPNTPAASSTTLLAPALAPTSTPSGVNRWLIISIIAAVIMIGVISWRVVLRRKA